MLTTSRPAGSYRAVASAVRTRILDVMTNDVPLTPSPMTGERINAIRDLLRLGSQYGPRPDSQLDTTGGSAPAKLDLARELVEQVPKHLPRYADTFDMRAWVEEAVGLLDALRAEAPWSELDDDQREFAEKELLPFLQNLLSLPPEAPDW